MLKWSRGTVRKLAGVGGRSVKLKSALCEVFHENTKLTPLSGREFGVRSGSFLRSAVARKLAATPYKVYSLVEQVALPNISVSGELEETIIHRRSRRSFSGDPVGLEDVARLLYLTYGLGKDGKGRPIASGGGLYPLEFYVTAWNVRDLKSGIYHYNVEAHCLDVVRQEAANCEELRKIVWLEDIEHVNCVAFIVFVAAMLPRTTIKYGDRGYRLVLMEAGEAVQNLALLASAMGVGCCALGGFLDNALSEYLDIDGVDEVPLVPVVFGSV